jgi:hypothetical protein
VLVAASAVTAGCGADAVDRRQEARELVHTCRSLQERANDTAGVALSQDRMAGYLASESGDDPDITVLSTLRRMCSAAGRLERFEQDRDLDRSGS